MHLEVDLLGEILYGSCANCGVCSSLFYPPCSCMLFVVFCSHLLIVLIVLCSSLVTCILCPNHYICSFMIYCSLYHYYSYVWHLLFIGVHISTMYFMFIIPAHSYHIISYSYHIDMPSTSSIAPLLSLIYFTCIVCNILCSNHLPITCSSCLSLSEIYTTDI